MLQQAAKLAVGTTAELAKGAGAVSGKKAAKLSSNFMEQAQQTLAARWQQPFGAKKMISPAASGQEAKAVTRQKTKLPISLITAAETRNFSDQNQVAPQGATAMP